MENSYIGGGELDVMVADYNLSYRFTLALDFSVPLVCILRGSDNEERATANRTLRGQTYVFLMLRTISQVMGLHPK